MGGWFQRAGEADVGRAQIVGRALISTRTVQIGGGSLTVQGPRHSLPGQNGTNMASHGATLQQGTIQLVACEGHVGHAFLTAALPAWLADLL
jgi:hypothetical protein